MLKKSAALLVLLLILVSSSVYGVDFYFVQDSTYGGLGDTVTLSGRIGPSDTLRSFTIYLYNDTTLIDLVPPATAGSLIAGHSGLQFDYFDHPPNAPHRLEIGGTIFGTDFWAGPGELFQVRFVLRGCGDVPLPADVGFRRPNGTFILGNYDAPVFLICDRVPASASELVIYRNNPVSMILHWGAVTQDTLGRLLLGPPEYLVYRQQIEPLLLPPVLIATVSDTFYVDPLDAADENVYHVVTQSSP